jgi:protein tyrosine/serine phosphatase
VPQDRLSRHLEWDGCLNARDLGGIPTLDGGETQWQSVIRADYLGRLSGAGQQSMHDYGVRTVIDLRSPQELVIDSYQLAAANDFLRLHLPIEKYYPHVGARIAKATSLTEVLGLTQAA